MKIFVASHPEPGVVCAARSPQELIDKLCFAFEYVSGRVEGDRLIFKNDPVYAEFGDEDVVYTMTELEV